LIELKESRGRARDARRLEEVHSIRIALEFYYDKNKSYPEQNGWLGSSILSRPISLTEDLEEHMSKVPADPRWSDSANPPIYGYAYHKDWKCNGSSYIVILIKTMENPANANYTNACADDSGNGTWFHIPDYGSKNTATRIIKVDKN